VLLASLVIFLAAAAPQPLDDASARAVVLLFTRTDCPISNRYAPEVKRVYEAYASQGVRFYLVYPDRDETIAAIEKHRSEFGYPMAAIQDPSHLWVARAQAKVTPEVAVFVPSTIASNAKRDWRLVYHGRIDDRYIDFGKSRREPSVHDLQNAIDAALAGRTIKPAETKAIGCFIADLR
jgi:hypothetical protein